MVLGTLFNFVISSPFISITVLFIEWCWEECEPRKSVWNVFGGGVELSKTLVKRFLGKIIYKFFFSIKFEPC